MNIDDKIKRIQENQEKNYVYVSPRMFTNGARLATNLESLNLFDNMNENTKNFAEDKIVNLISSANINNQEISEELRFNLIFQGTIFDLPDDLGNPIDFILNNRERIVAIYKYVESTEEREFYLKYPRTETFYNYGYLYISLDELLKEFEEKGISYKIDAKDDMHGYMRTAYRDDTETKFVISYNPKKEKNNGSKKTRLLRP